MRTSPRTTSAQNVLAGDFIAEENVEDEQVLRALRQLRVKQVDESRTFLNVLTWYSPIVLEQCDAEHATGKVRSHHLSKDCGSKFDIQHHIIEPFVTLW